MGLLSWLCFFGGLLSFSFLFLNLYDYSPLQNLILKLENMVSQLLILERRGRRKIQTGRKKGGNPLQPRLQVQPGPPRQQAGWTLLVLPPLLNQLPLVVEPRCTQT